MKCKFVGERGTNVSPQDRQTINVLYTIDEALEVFIQAKIAEGIRQGTIKEYHEIFRYFKNFACER